jgi:hypothetical protein
MNSPADTGSVNQTTIEGAALALRQARARLFRVYSSFLRHAETAADRYGLTTVDILVELGRRHMVGGRKT